VCGGEGREGDSRVKRGDEGRKGASIAVPRWHAGGSDKGLAACTQEESKAGRAERVSLLPIASAGNGVV
jgi:hypothetical protein